MDGFDRHFDGIDIKGRIHDSGIFYRDISCSVMSVTRDQKDSSPFHSFSKKPRWGMAQHRTSVRLAHSHGQSKHTMTQRSMKAVLHGTFIFLLSAITMVFAISMPPTVYLPGGGFPGFWFHLGYLQSLRNLMDYDYYCFSSGCLGTNTFVNFPGVLIVSKRVI